MDALQGAIDVDTNIFFSINRMHNMYFDYLWGTERNVY